MEKRLKADYDLLIEKGFEVVGVFAYGSYNYGLEDEYSDIDTKAIILPKFDDIVDSKEWVSETFIEADNSILEVKDIRLMFNSYLKQNINFLETLFTSHYILNDNYVAYFSGMVQKNAERIAHYDKVKALNTMLGNMESKYKSMFKVTPHSEDDINKYGYSLKDYHHLLRLAEFIERYIDGEPYSDCLISKNKMSLLLAKRTPKEANFVQKEAEKLLKSSKSAVFATINSKNYGNIDTEVKNILQTVQRELIRQSLTRELNLLNN